MISTIELFSGIGAQAKALKRLGERHGLEYDIVATSEIDKDAILSYAAIHCSLTPDMVERHIEEDRFPSKEKMIHSLQSKNIGYDFKKMGHTITARTNIDKIRRYWLAAKLQNCIGDISKLERLPYADLWTYSFPCTDVSSAGKRQGITTGTRSGLLLEVERLLRVAQKENMLPKFLLMENVKGLVSSTFLPDFTRWLDVLESLGYSTKWDVMNAKDYGIPQNRERVFAISIRSDIDVTFRFPVPVPLTRKLRDILEDSTPERYYIAQEISDRLISQIEKKNISNTIRTTGGGH